VNEHDNIRKETEDTPAMEVHLGEIRHTSQYYRHAIIWINGKRWEGDLVLTKETPHGESSPTQLQ
jgi:hypothetical protein